MSEQKLEDAANQNPLTHVPLDITVAIGRARPSIRDLLHLSRGAVLVLDRRADDPVELYIGEKLIARGELQELDGDQAGQLAVRLTEVAAMETGL